MNNYDEKYGAEEAFIVDPEGFVKVVRHLAARTFTANDQRLRFNEVVTEVHYSLATDQSVPVGLPEEGVYVKTASGNEYYARFAIITFSVSSYPSSFLLFESILFDYSYSYDRSFAFRTRFC